MVSLTDVLGYNCVWLVGYIMYFISINTQAHNQHTKHTDILTRPTVIDTVMWVNMGLTRGHVKIIRYPVFRDSICTCHPT